MCSWDKYKTFLINRQNLIPSCLCARGLKCNRVNFQNGQFSIQSYKTFHICPGASNKPYVLGLNIRLSYQMGSILITYPLGAMGVKSVKGLIFKTVSFQSGVTKISTYVPGLKMRLFWDRGKGELNHPLVARRRGVKVARMVNFSNSSFWCYSPGNSHACKLASYMTFLPYSWKKYHSLGDRGWSDM